MGGGKIKWEGVKIKRKINVFQDKIYPTKFCLSLCLFLILACSSFPSLETKQAKAYEAQLFSLQHEPEVKILPLIEKEWKFELLRVEKIADLSSPQIKALLPRRISFSDEEIKTLFSDPGVYKLLVYIKEIGTSAATTGEITDLGLSATKDTAYVVRHYSLIRLIFKDGQLVHSRVWPRIDSSQLAEGVIRIK
ncbi:MAG: hypothetical protein ACUVR0_05155 [Candidatus Aminicenantales bacterium]